MTKFADEVSVRTQLVTKGKAKDIMKKLMVVGALAAIAAGCVTVNKNDGGDSAIAPNVIKDTVREKYAVGSKTVSATDNLNCLFGFICWGSTATHIADLSDSGFGGVGKVKNGAYANACDAGKCDALVGAKYKVTTEDYFVFAKIKAEVTGYPVTITGAEVIPAEKTGGFCQGGVKETGKSATCGLLPFL